jgi:hypothetical protein
MSERHVREPWHKPVMLHLADCEHFDFGEEGGAIMDPELRAATGAEQARNRDEHGRIWRKCKHCLKRANS